MGKSYMRERVEIFEVAYASASLPHKVRHMMMERLTILLHTSAGIAGHFTGAVINRLVNCLPQGVYYIEGDRQVTALL